MIICTRCLIPFNIPFVYLLSFTQMLRLTVRWELTLPCLVAHKIINHQKGYCPISVDLFLACPVGTYGFQCLYNCSENCLNISTCNVNGSCDGACATGWGGDSCNLGKQFCFEKWPKLVFIFEAQLYDHKPRIS